MLLGMAASTTRAPRRPAPAFGFGDRLRVVRRELRLTQGERDLDSPAWEDTPLMVATA